MTAFTFQKEERLKSRKIINQLFDKKSSQSFACHPIRIVYQTLSLPSPVPIQIAFSVSKRRFKSAVKRNRIKRQLVEAFRLNKSQIYDHLNAKNRQCAVMLIFQSSKEYPFDELEQQMIHLLQKLERKID